MHSLVIDQVTAFNSSVRYFCCFGADGSLEMFLAAESDASQLFHSLMNKIQTIINKIECSLLVLVDRLNIKGVDTSHWLNRDLTNDMVFDLENAIAFLKSN